MPKLETPPDNDFPIVGIGASAGGLAAFEAFFSGMPTSADPGMAFVLVQHLAPDHKSILTGLIQRYTRMQVLEVEDGMVVKPNCAYIIPPGRDMAFLNGSLQLLEPAAPRGHRLPIDFFFRSLAQDQRERAICIVLSGTGSDGTLGVRAIKAEGGMVMAQDPETTEYAGMPVSAINTGLVDYQLPPAEMPAQLMAYVNQAFGKNHRSTIPPAAMAENNLKKIFILLRAQTGHDFSHYKPSTINRRIERRMAVHQIEVLTDYIKYMQQTPAEVEALFRDLLIGVTNFFRDPDLFKVVEERIIPELFAGKPPGSTIRVWSPGCSTGEEAYSIAILLQERMETIKKNYQVQIFATDLDNQAIATARTGLYPASIGVDLTPERLARFFVSEADGGGYRVAKIIRDILVFSEQDLIRDPPFSRLDLISCRNLLIYMSGSLQKKIIPLFHYSLNPNGILFLGSSETIGDFDSLFTVLDRKAKLYRRKDDPHETGNRAYSRFLPATSTPAFGVGKPNLPAKLQLRELTERAIIDQITPVAILINGQGDILYLHGRTGMYLEPAPGETGVNNILKMAREGLRRELTTTLHKTIEKNHSSRCFGLQVKTNGDYTMVNLAIHPLAKNLTKTVDQQLYIVTLEKTLPAQLQPENLPVEITPEGKQTDPEIIRLKQELQAKEEYLQTTTEELETSNEELKSANEEMQSVNEELQSTNEELETSKEELQSVNEELATVNAELQTKVADLTLANNDMNNLLAGTGIGTVFIDLGLRILRFTPAATKIINLMRSDVGRPVGHIVSNLVGYDSLVADVQATLDTLLPKEAEVQTIEGKWYNMRIQPYRTLSNVIEGVVITFVDISTAKQILAQLQLNEERMRVALNVLPLAVFNQDTELRYTWIGNADTWFGRESFLGKTDYELLPADEAEKLTALKKQVMQSGKGECRELTATIGGKTQNYELTIEPLYDCLGALQGITGTAIVSTARRH